MVNMVIIMTFAGIGCYAVSKFVVHKGIAVQKAWKEVRAERLSGGADPDEDM